LMADLRHDLGQTYIVELDKADVAVIHRMLDALEARVKGIFTKENIGDSEIAISYELDLRYVGQEHTLAVDISAPIAETDKPMIAKAFDDLHLRIYGHNAPVEPKEIVSLKVIGIGEVTKPVLERIPVGDETPPPEAQLKKRNVYVGNGKYIPFSIYHRDKLLAGNVISGPTVIEEITATTVVEVGQTCRVDEYGNLIISLDKEGK